MYKQHSAFSSPLSPDENSTESSPLAGPSQTYAYNKMTHNGVKPKIFKKAGILIKKEEPELARKRNELRAIREQIMLKRASFGLTSSSFASDDPDPCSEDEEPDRPIQSNKRLQEEKVLLPLQDRIKQILLQRGISKVTRTRRKPIKDPQDHPLKFRVQMALQRRFRDPPVRAPNAQIPMLAQEEDNQGFLRFLNILNKGVDIDKLKEIISSTTERESNSQKRKDAKSFRSKTPEEEQPLPKKANQQKNLQYILNTLGLSLDTDDINKMADRTQERLYGGKNSTEEEKDKTRDKGRKRSKDRYSPGQYTRAGSTTSSTSNRYSPAKSSSSSRRHKSPQRSSKSQRSSGSRRRYRSPSVSPRRYRRSRSPYRRRRYSRSRSSDSSWDSNEDSYRDSSYSSYSSYYPRSGNGWDPRHSYQSSTQPYPYQPPQQYCYPPYQPQMYPPQGPYATHSQHTGYYGSWGYSQTSVSWSSAPGQMYPPYMPPVMPSPQTDPNSSLLEPPPESVDITEPPPESVDITDHGLVGRNFYSTYNSNANRCLLTINSEETTEEEPLGKVVMVVQEPKKYNRFLKNNRFSKNNVPNWSAVLKQQKQAIARNSIKEKAKKKPWNNRNKRRKKLEQALQDVPLMESIQTIPELIDEEVGDKLNVTFKRAAFKSKKKKPSPPPAVTEIKDETKDETKAETKGELADDEAEEKPSLTEDEIKANLKLKLKAFNSKMMKRTKRAAAAEAKAKAKLNKPSLKEDEVKAKLISELEGVDSKKKKRLQPKKKADNI